MKTANQQMYAAMEKGNAAEVARLVAAHPELLRPKHVSDSWLHEAARSGQIPLIDALLAAGADINLHDDNEGPPLEKAVNRGQLEAARHLIARGADVNIGRELIGAINSQKNSLELVKLLVDAGTDVNRWWHFGDPKQGIIQNALSWALAKDRADIADYLRAHGALPPPKAPRLTPLEAMEQGIEEETIAYFDKHLGPVSPLSLGEIVPSSPVRVHAILAGGTRQHITLFTTGMATSALRVPSGQQQYRYVELFVQLPANWPYQDVADARHSWPIHWLRMLAHYPHERQSWLPPVSIIEDDPPGPLAPGSNFTAMLVLAEQSFASKQGYPVQLYRLTPLYAEEQALEAKHGIDALMRAFDEHSVPFIVDPKRRNVAL